ncbi:hypothetical protein [Rhodovibrio salinarum]|uniref:Uncharacterized protein n=1 Tax=Rhodovibrio salinarum TaxID=1087 RepID=A0A934V0B4_9PROT|nr:hypothetical protein [Rhodovibrio salinarum]MBK1698052.1 hypothetical protein [Rhodovibrio salinarum]
MTREKDSTTLGEGGKTARDIQCEKLDPNLPCNCREAVCRAYREMVARGASHVDAHQVAARVYRHHHPNQPAAQVNRLVTRLVEPAPLH